MINKLSKKNEMQKRKSAAPIIEAAKLPKMDDADSIKPARFGGTELYMDDEVKSPAAMKKGSKQKEGFMKPVPRYKRSSSKAKSSSMKEIGEQEEIPQEKNFASGEEEGYVRLHMRVMGDDISLIGAKTVEGPLVEPDKLQSGLIYEANHDNKRVGFGWITDSAEKRSYPSPDAKSGQGEHHVTEVSSFEFNARITKENYSRLNLPELQISVYQVKSEPPSQYFGSAPLSDQFDSELREIAQLNGIKLKNLDDNVKKDLQKLK